MSDLDRWLSREASPTRVQKAPQLGRIISDYFTDRQELPVLTQEQEDMIDQEIIDQQERLRERWRARNFKERETTGDEIWYTAEEGKGKKRKSRRHRTRRKGRTRTKKEKPRRKSARRKSTRKHRK